MGSARAVSGTGHAEVPAVVTALGLQCARGCAEQWLRISLKTTSPCVRDIEPRYVSSSKWCLGHPPLPIALMLCTKQGETGLG